MVADPDRNLVSVCVEKVVLAKVAEIIRTGFDPLSTTGTNKIIGKLIKWGLDQASTGKGGQ